MMMRLHDMPSHTDEMMRWTCWRGMDHTSDFGCSVFFLSLRASPCKPQPQTLHRASWDPTEHHSGWQTQQGPPDCW